MSAVCRAQKKFDELTSNTLWNANGLVKDSAPDALSESGPIMRVFTHEHLSYNLDLNFAAN